MPIARVNGHLIIFVHVPKCGGETTEKYLQSVTEDGSAVAFLRPPDRTALPCSPQHLHGPILRYLFGAAFFDYGFAIVRDPIARAISEYRFRAAPRLANGQHVAEFPQWWRRTRQRYARNPFILDNHIRPQAEFLSRGIAKRFDVFHFEDGLLANLARVFETLDTPFRDLGIHTHRVDDVAVHLDEATFESLVVFYAADIKEFGYDVNVLRDRHLAG